MNLIWANVPVRSPTAIVSPAAAVTPVNFAEPLPEALLQRLLTAANFNRGFATVEYAACAMLDLDLHSRADPGGLDIAAYEQEFVARIGMPSEIGLWHRPAHFQHLFAGGGYAAAA